jgi:excisionase family DNA binding protein
LTPPEVAKLLRVSPDTVVSWVKSGLLRGYNVGRAGCKRKRFRIDRSDLEDFKASRVPCPRVKAARRPQAPRGDVPHYFR